MFKYYPMERQVTSKNHVYTIKKKTKAEKRILSKNTLKFYVKIEERYIRLSVEVIFILRLEQ